MYRSVIVAVLLLAIVWLLYRDFKRPQEVPPEIQQAEDSIAFKRRLIDSLLLKGQELRLQIEQDSIESAKAKQGYETRIAALTRKLKAINTSKSGQKELDSLIIVLYGEN